jgi:hypothetical protein
MPVPAAAAGAAASVSVAMVSNFPFGSGVSAVRLPQAHLLTSAHFRARAPGPVSDRLSDTTAREEQSFAPVFPLPFGCRRSLLEHPIPAGGTGPSLRLGYRTQIHGRTPTVVTTLRTIETRPGWVPPLPRDGGVHAADRGATAATCRFPAASPTPQHHIPSPGLPVTRSQQRFSVIHPSGQFPLPVAPGWRGCPWT